MTSDEPFVPCFLKDEKGDALPTSMIPRGTSMKAYTAARMRRLQPDAPGPPPARNFGGDADAERRAARHAMAVRAPQMGTAQSKVPRQVIGCSAVVSAANPTMMEADDGSRRLCTASAEAT